MTTFNIFGFIDELLNGNIETSKYSNTGEFISKDKNIPFKLSIEHNVYSKRTMSGLENGINIGLIVHAVMLCVSVVLLILHILLMGNVAKMEKSYTEIGRVLDCEYYPKLRFDDTVEPNFFDQEPDQEYMGHYNTFVGDLIKYSVLNTKTGVVHTIYNDEIASKVEGATNNTLDTITTGQYITLAETRKAIGDAEVHAYINSVNITGIEECYVDLEVSTNLYDIGAFAFLDKETDISFIRKIELPVEVGDTIRAYRHYDGNRLVYKFDGIDYVDGMSECSTCVVELMDTFSDNGTYSIAMGINIDTQDIVNVYYDGDYTEGMNLIANKFCVNGDDRYMIID